MMTIDRPVSLEVSSLQSVGKLLEHPLMPSRPTPKLSVVSPCYNEERSLDELYRRLTAVCNAEVAGGDENVVVGDGSSDPTRLILGEHCPGGPPLLGGVLSPHHD